MDSLKFSKIDASCNSSIATMAEISVDSTNRVGSKRIMPQDEEDRISGLPDSLIQHILSLLPSTMEAVRTGVLSKRWLNQWTQVPVLIFQPPYVSDDEYLRFIENTLILHDCPKIKKFHLGYHFESPPDLYFASKIRFAVRKCVEELTLICYNVNGEQYFLPKFLSDNASLVRLEMVCCYFMPTRRVNWPSLKSLTVEYDYYDICSKGIENFVSGSPLLEWFELRKAINDRVVIVSNSLKVLSFVDLKVSGAIEISCPNLLELNVASEHDSPVEFPDQAIENALSGSPFIRSLKLVGCAGFNKLVIASKSLKVLHLEDVDTALIEVSCPNLEKLLFRDCCGDVFKAVNLPSSICATLDNLSGSPKQLLEKFQHVNKLTIGRCFLKVISDLDVEVRLSLPLLTSKCLTLDVGDNFGLTLPGIAYALSSPMLETLVINLKFRHYEDELDKDLHDYWNSYGSTGFTCLESHLKIVKIIDFRWRDGTSKLVFEFMEFLLKNARVLEKMTVLKNLKKIM